MKLETSFILIIFTVLLFSCSKEDEKLIPVCDGSNLTYDTGVSAIISANCNNAGCHNSGSSNGDYTTYNGIQQDLNNGNFNNRVFDKQDMPQGSASLTQTHINQLKCWSENGFLEN